MNTAFMKRLRRPGRWTIAACLVLLAIAVYLTQFEYWNLPSFAFVASTTVALIAGLLLATRRLFFSSIVAAAILAGLVVASETKVAEMGVPAQAYDILAYLRWDVVVYLAREFPQMMLGTLGFLIVAMCIAVAAYRYDRSRVSRWLAGACLLVSSTVSFAQHDRPELQTWVMAFNSFPVTSFYLSVPSAVTVLSGGSLFRAADHSEGPPLNPDYACGANPVKPDIILIHHESATPPWFYPAINYNRSLDPFFLSPDGTFRPFLVEVFGAGSVLTIFAVLTGIPALYFEDMYWQTVKISLGRVRQALPELLSDCGYDTSLFYPLPRTFSADEHQLYPSIGFKNIIDMQDMGFVEFLMLDRLLYDQALKRLERADAAKPNFMFIQTQFVHAPYDSQPSPEQDTKKGDPRNAAPVNEYLRRLGLAQRDYNDFVTALKQRFPQRRFLIVRYGDHQPPLMMDFFGRESARLEAIREAYAPQPLDQLRDQYRATSFLTFFAMEGVNFTPLPIPETPVTSAVYLSALTLTAAGLPLPDADNERLRIYSECQGQYFTCERQDDILTFHRRLIDAGIFMGKP